jgi:hypothetical protein
MLCIVGFIFLTIISFTCGIINIGANHVERSVENAVVSYDEYQDIYRTCKKLNTDLGVIQSTPDNDKQFDQFSKSQRINAIKMDLNRWVEEYNAKSKHIDKKWWKSDELPYQLDVNQFSNYK